MFCKSSVSELLSSFDCGALWEINDESPRSESLCNEISPDKDFIWVWTELSSVLTRLRNTASKGEAGLFSAEIALVNKSLFRSYLELSNDSTVTLLSESCFSGDVTYKDSFLAERLVISDLLGRTSLQYSLLLFPWEAMGKRDLGVSAGASVGEAVWTPSEKLGFSFLTLSSPLKFLCSKSILLLSSESSFLQK